MILNKQTAIADLIKISYGFMSQIVNEKRRPSWPNARRLSVITDTDPGLWMDGSKKEMTKAIKENQKKYDSDLQQKLMQIKNFKRAV